MHTPSFPETINHLREINWYYHSVANAPWIHVICPCNMSMYPCSYVVFVVYRNTSTIVVWHCKLFYFFTIPTTIYVDVLLVLCFWSVKPMHIYMCVYVYTHTHMYAYTHTYIYNLTYTFTHTRTHKHLC